MIRNVWAIGRNYSDHAKELGNPVPAEPLVFLKAGSTCTLAEAMIPLPPGHPDLHHEVELALQFDENLHIFQAALALDLTDRSTQNRLKPQAAPWTLAKSFKGSCPLTAFFPVQNLEELTDLEILLKVNGQVRQQGRTSQMIFSLNQLIEFVRFHFPVCPGDLLLTGTPAGVGPLQKGDRVEAEIPQKIKHLWTVG